MRSDRGPECLDPAAGRDAREHCIRLRQGLEGEDLRLRPQAGGKQRELATIGANIDHAREVASAERARVLDGGGDAVAQAGTKTAIGHEAQQLARTAHEFGRGAAAGGELVPWSNLPRSRSHARS
jgi:hypothetical protein